MFTVEIVYSLFLQPLSWTGEGEGKGEGRDRAGILRMSGFSYFIPLWMVSYKLPWCLHIPVNELICLLTGGGCSNAEISALWPRSCGFRNMLIKILIR